MKSKNNNTRKNTVRIARALALSAFLLAAPAARAVPVVSKDAQAQLYDGYYDSNKWFLGGPWWSNDGRINYTGVVELSIINNWARGSGNARGAAWYTSYNIKISVHSLDVSNNSADVSQDGQTTAEGGALYAMEDVIVITRGEAADASFSNNGNKAVSTNNAALALGGAIANDYDDRNNYYAYDISLDIGGKLTLSRNFVTAEGNGDIVKQGTFAQGGAVSNRGGAMKNINEGNIYLRADEMVIRDNTASSVSNKKGGSSAIGGALAARNINWDIDDRDQFTMYGGCIAITARSIDISSNSAGAKANTSSGNAQRQGYALAHGGAAVAMSGMRIAAEEQLMISGNSADAYSASGQAQAHGGALYSFTAEDRIDPRDVPAIVLSAKEKLTISGNSVHAQGNQSPNDFDGHGRAFGGARGGALFADPRASKADESRTDAISIDAGELIVSGNTASAELLSKTKTEVEAYGGAFYAERGDIIVTADKATFSRNGVFADNKANSGNSNVATAKGGALAHLWTEDNHDWKPQIPTTLKIVAQSFDFSDNFAYAKSIKNKANAYGGAVYMYVEDTASKHRENLQIGDASTKYIKINANSASADAPNPVAQGGAFWIIHDITLNAAKIEATNNTAKVTGSTSAKSLGGVAFSEKGNITINADELSFSGNEATLGGALYADAGNIVLKGLNAAGGAFTFATSTDDVYAKGGNITITGALSADQGTSFTAIKSNGTNGTGGEFSMGDNSSLTLTGQLFTENAAERKAGDLTIFGGNAEGSINFNKTELTLTNYEDLLPDSLRDFKVDVATLLYKNDPGFEDWTDVTNKEWAPVKSSSYPSRLRFYIHTAVTGNDSQTADFYSSYGHAYKLVLAFGRNSLIWRGLADTQWNEGVEGNQAWLSASEDNFFVPALSGDEYISNSFYRSDTVVFDGMVYNDLTKDSEVPAVNTLTVSLAPDTDGLVAPSDVYVISGDYRFTGTDSTTLRADRLYLSSDRTSVDFALPVSVSQRVSVDQATVSFAKLTALGDTAVDISGTARVKDAENGVYTVLGGGELTLADGGGTLTGLTVNGNATLNVNTPGQYGVSGTFNALGSSRTYFNFENWESGSGFGISGGTSATLSEGAVLTISGIALSSIAGGSTGTWTLLKDFTQITVRDNAWSYVYNAPNNTLSIDTTGDLADYIVTTSVDVDGQLSSYVLRITRPGGNLIWTGASGDVWKTDIADRSWKIASDDLETPYEYTDGREFTDVFSNDKIVTFNSYGEKQTNVTVSGEVKPSQVRVTAGEYTFSGENSGILTNSLYVSGDDTAANFALPVSVSQFVSVDAASVDFAKLTALADTSVDISGKMSVKDAENGVYSVLEVGELTLADGKGTLTGLTVDKGATLNVNTPGQYGVSGTFNALGDSDTNFNFTEWGSESGFGIDGGGTASASVKENARLTISGIAPDAKGTWTLLNNFANIDIDDTAWSYDEGTLVINGRTDLDDYIVENTVRTVSVGKSYILTITRPDGDLIWNGTGGDVWNEGSDDRPWLIAKSDDLDTPFEYKDRRFAEAFESGDIVTFNSVGVKQENVTVSGDVHAAWLRVTAGSYSFNGDGVITADTLELDDSKFGTGTNARFDVAVNVNKLLESGAETQAWLNELNMEEKATANVNGQLELANVTGGVFTVNEGGILTLSGGTGSSAMTGLSVNGGATLNVNTLSGYGVTDSFAAENGSSTVFDFGKEWKPGSGYAIGGNGSAGATLSDGAELTIVGIEAGKEGTWTLLDGFTNVDAGGTAWHFAYDGGTVTIKTPDGEKRDDLDDYVVKTEVVTTAVDGVEGKSYVLTITRPQGELIWNGTGSDVWSAGISERPWLIASDDLDTAFVYQDRTFASAFADGKTVTFNSYGEKQTNVTVSGDVTANQLRVTAGEYEFSGGGRITASELMTASKDTKASFAVPVNVSESLDIGAETKAVLEQLRLELNTPAGVSGKLDLATVTGGQFTIDKDGELTLSGGTGSLAGLTLNDGATLNVESLSSYSVTESFKAHAGSETYFHFGTWNAGDGWGISGLGEKATAELASGATLTIDGIKPGDTGKWNLLSNFSSINTGGWSKRDGTIKITDYDIDSYGYPWDTYVDGTNFVLVISKDEPIPPTPPTPPDGELIWTGTDGATDWSSASEKKPWLIASSEDLDKPYTDESGDTVPAAFTNGKTVTFNNEGKDQNIVNVVDAVTADQVRVTAGEYEFRGDGKITASELLTANEGTTAKFTVPVSLTDKLDIGANTEATLEQLRMELNTPADVSGKLDLATVTGGGKFTVYKDGELTLSGGTGTMTSLTVNDGATLTVSSLGSYSVTDSFNALGGSVTYFNFGTWNAGESWGISGLGESAKADLGKGATLTIAGISKGATGKWTLLSNFSSITADGWSKAGKTIKIEGYDIDSYDDYTWDTYVEGTNYVLVISQDEPPVPPTPPTPEPADPGHTEVFHIAHSVQANVSAAAESAALGELDVDPKYLWASMWRENGRVSDSGLIQKNRAYGLVIGRDLNRDENRTWGVAAHIGKGDTSGKGAWDGATSDTEFWGVMVYGRHDTDKWRFTGDAGVSWFRTDYTDANGAKADNARAAMLSVGGRAYYKWVDDPRPGKMNVLPFIGLRWNSYRQNAYSYNNGSDSGAWTADQVLVPIGVRFAWGENVTPSGWRLSPSVELSWTGAFGDKKVKTGIFSGKTSHTAVDSPLFDSGTFGAQVRFNAHRDAFHMDLNAGVRKSSKETDFNVGATFKWELGARGEIATKKREPGRQRGAQLNRGKYIASASRGDDYSVDFRTKVVLEVIAGKSSLEAICAKYALEPATVRAWGKEHAQKAMNAFN